MELDRHSPIILSFQVGQASLPVIISLLCKEGSSFDRRIEGELSFFSLLPIVIPCYDTESTSFTSVPAQPEVLDVGNIQESIQL